MTHARGWAKYDPITDPEVAAQVRAATEADRHRYTREGMLPVECKRCGTEVLVKKNTPFQTSVQWRSEAVTSCPRLAEGAQAGTPSALQDGCPDLDASIVHAVKVGAIPLPEDPDRSKDESDA